MLRASTVVLACGVSLACGPEYPSGRVLERPRALAVRLEPPEAALGDSVYAEVLVAAPEGHESPVRTSLWQCPPTDRFPHGCADADDASWLGETSGEVEVGEDWRFRVERADPFDVYLVVTAEVETDDDRDTTIKRLVVGVPEEGVLPNQNPVLSALLVDDEVAEEGPEVVVAPGGRVRLRPVVAETSVERYTLRTLDGGLHPAEEEMYVSYYASCGVLGAGLTRGERLASSWQAPEEGACTVWAILRDGRGGTDWRSRRFVAAP